MNQKKKFLQCKHGLGTVTAIFLLLLMILTLTGLIVIFSNTNINLQAINQINSERAQERISLQKQISNQEIISVIITNDGSIGAQIRSIYEIKDGVTTFLGDPTSDFTVFVASETYIPSGKSITITFQEGKAPQQEATIIAATQRGTKSFDTSYNPTPTLGATYPPTDLVVGPLLLRFKDFQYQETVDGTINPTAWESGWDVPKGIYCAWKIKVTNIDERNITLSRYSGFTPVANEFSTIKTWFLDPTFSETQTQLLRAGEETDIVFVWSAPKNLPATGLPNTPASFYNAECTCSIFLTFYGQFHELDGITITPYAQTIPFEAAVMTK